MMKDSSSKKNALLIERLCETFGALYQGNVIDKNWLCARFGVTERTAYRDLSRLAHLLEEVSIGRYKLSRHLQPTLHVGQLADFARFTGVSHLFPHNDGKSLRNHLQKPENITIQGAGSRDNRQLSVLMGDLDKAISACRMVAFSYRNKSRAVQPYRLINHYGLWYLAGMEEGSLKAFELARIEQFSLCTTQFPIDEAVTQQLNTTQGIHFGPHSQATLWVSAHAAQYVMRRSLFPGQQIVQTHTDGSLTLSTAVKDKHTLFRWLRYWLPDIRILAPTALKNDFNEDFNRRAKANDNNDCNAAGSTAF